jgi:hypothetical protein
MLRRCSAAAAAAALPLLHCHRRCCCCCQEYTNYHFDVAPAHLEGALDRLAQFFVKPLFLVSAHYM